MRRFRLLTATFALTLGLPLVAAGQSLSFSVTLENLVPGVSQTETGTVLLVRAATIRSFEWMDRTGLLEDASLEVEVCTPQGLCVDADNPGNTIFPAGELTIFVTATLSASSSIGGTGRAVGSIVFSADDDGLPDTGIELFTIAVWGFALVSLGLLLVLIARRREQEVSV